MAGRRSEGPSSAPGAVPSALELQKPGKGLLVVDLGLGGEALWWSYREGTGGWRCFGELDMQGPKKRGLGEACLIWVVLLLIVKLTEFMCKTRIIWVERKLESMGVSYH